VSGAPLITQEIERYLGVHPGENTDDMLFTLEEVHCVGACGMAPVVMINDRAHGKLTREKGVAVVKQFREAELAAHNNGDGHVCACAEAAAAAEEGAE
jgi:NADH:ubiquinone oxidoreductase subunit E